MAAKEEDIVDVKDIERWSKDFLAGGKTFVKYLDRKVRVKLDDESDREIRVNEEVRRVSSHASTHTNTHTIQDVFPRGDSDACKPEFLPLVRAASKATWMKRRRDMKSLTLEKPLGSRPKGVSSETAKTFVNEFVPMLWAELEGKGKMKKLRARFKKMLEGGDKSEDADKDTLFKIGSDVNVRTYIPDGRVPKVKWLKATFQGSAPPVDLTPCLGKFKHNASINSRVCLYRGDISAINVDAVQNAANRGLNRGGGVCGAIHKRAGPSLEDACKKIPCKDDEVKEEEDRVRCPVGETRLTGGFDLPAKYVLHSVGPQNGTDTVGLSNAYRSALDLAAKNEDISSVALCCLSTGIFGFPLENAAHVAILTVREWLEKNKDKVDTIVFCVFGEKDLAIYFELMRHYFPIDE